MTNSALSILLLSTNWLGQPIPTVRVDYRSPGPYALMASRDMQQWQLVVGTTNDWPHQGQVWLPMIDRHLFWLNTNVFTGSIPEQSIKRIK